MDKRIKDITGQKFNCWTVIKLDEQKHKKKGAYWICKCDCGTIKSVWGASLRDGSSKSCGCTRTEKIIEIGHKNRLDLTNQRFGKLVALYPVSHKDNNTSVYWVCQCDCGTITQPISAQNLRNGDTKSCGCVISRGNNKIKQLLLDLNISFISEKTFEDLYYVGKLRFDFYLPKYNILIEYQGKQHYEPQQPFGGLERFEIQTKCDNLKREYCKKHNIKLIEIPYWDYNKLNEDYLLLKINS